MYSSSISSSLLRPCVPPPSRPRYLGGRPQRARLSFCLSFSPNHNDNDNEVDDDNRIKEKNNDLSSALYSSVNMVSSSARYRSGRPGPLRPTTLLIEARGPLSRKTEQRRNYGVSAAAADGTGARKIQSKMILFMLFFHYIFSEQHSGQQKKQKKSHTNIGR